ncbi:MAG: butyrate kinase [Candidatus Omnitrophica bacterium]|nr:butyrate kinase [Candidatus Omnitrophota bacterium]
MFKILVINPGSTSTKLALFNDEEMVFEENIAHNPDELKPFKKIKDQYSFRKELILGKLEKHKVKLDELHAVVGRGGLMRPLPGGTYKINKKMVEDLEDESIWQLEHASNLGCLIAHEIGKKFSIPAFTVDPVPTDEMEPVARISGFPEIERRSLFHALNVKAVARNVAGENLIIAHMGGGISVCALRGGKVIDVNNALLGMGPFSPQRAGGLPIGDLVRLCYSGKYKLEELLKKLTKEGGLIAYLGTDSVPEIEKSIENGDEKAALVLEAMAYQTAKEIAACASVLEGHVDAIVLTGGIAKSGLVTEKIIKRVSFIAKVLIYPGEEEMKALARGALRVLKAEEKAKEYS